MGFCKSCGNNINDGEKFCGTCGAAVFPVQAQQQVHSSSNYQGQINPNYRPATQLNTQSYTPAKVNVNTDEILTYLKDAWGIVKAMCMKPMTFITDVAQTMKKESFLILAVLLPILYGLLSLLTTTAAISSASKNIIIKTSLDFIGGPDIISKPKVFFMMVLLYVIATAIVSGTYLAAGKILLNTDVDLISVAKVNLAATIPFIAFMILQVIFIYVYMPLGFALGFVGTLVGIFTLFKGMNNLLKMPEDISTYLLAIVVLIIAFIFYLVGKSIVQDVIRNATEGLIRNFPF